MRVRRDAENIWMFIRIESGRSPTPSFYLRHQTKEQGLEQLYGNVSSLKMPINIISAILQSYRKYAAAIIAVT